jgi:hypothetical protein
MKAVRGDVNPASIMGNEVPQWYEVSIPAVFGIKAKFHWGCTIDDLHKCLYNKRGALVTLKSPGHYIAIIADDAGTSEFIYHDPWPGNNWPVYNQGKPGAGRRVKYADLMKNVQSYRVEIGN